MIRYTKEYIQSLLDKYMDGTTTLEEEDILASYFRGNNIPQEWEDYRQLFEEIEAMKPQPKSDRRWIGWSIAAAAIVAGHECEGTKIDARLPRRIAQRSPHLDRQRPGQL